MSNLKHTNQKKKKGRKRNKIYRSFWESERNFLHLFSSSKVHTTKSTGQKKAINILFFLVKMKQASIYFHDCMQHQYPGGEGSGSSTQAPSPHRVVSSNPSFCLNEVVLGTRAILYFPALPTRRHFLHIACLSPPSNQGLGRQTEPAERAAFFLAATLQKQSFEIYLIRAENYQRMAYVTIVMNLKHGVVQIYFNVHNKQYFKFLNCQNKTLNCYPIPQEEKQNSQAYMAHFGSAN